MHIYCEKQTDSYKQMSQLRVKTAKPRQVNLQIMIFAATFCVVSDIFGSLWRDERSGQGPQSKSYWCLHQKLFWLPKTEA